MDLRVSILIFMLFLIFCATKMVFLPHEDGGEVVKAVLQKECSEWPLRYPLCKHQLTALGPGLRVFCKQSRHFRNIIFVSSDPNVI